MCQCLSYVRSTPLFLFIPFVTFTCLLAPLSPFAFARSGETSNTVEISFMVNVCAFLPALASFPFSLFPSFSSHFLPSLCLDLG